MVNDEIMWWEQYSYTGGSLFMFLDDKVKGSREFNLTGEVDLVLWESGFKAGGKGLSG